MSKKTTLALLISAILCGCSLEIETDEENNNEPDNQVQDSDNDGFNDNDDRFPHDPNEWADADLDGVGDNTDNCLEIPNPNQFDENENSVGDACDIFAFDQSAIPFTSDEDNLEGIVAWNVGAPAIEDENTGHRIPDPYYLENINEYAYYYLASRDYAQINPNSPGVIAATDGAMTGFPHFANAMQTYGYSESDIRLRFGLMTLGDDVEGVDWQLNGDTETRYYTGGTFSIELDETTILSGDMPQLTLDIKYNVAQNPLDDEISGITEPVDSQSINVVADDNVMQIMANAFLADVAQSDVGLRLVFDSIQPAGQSEYEDVNNARGGAYFEPQNGRLEIVQD
ncbi:hypothetical protein [Catenovulum sediminis]|uniref:hypothetical protein n=1 Tax=Catenovulum sediminis TaxID=1740262 RepID=UPI00118039F1|nr:hypothetical protein [Catenovulum sediminis]